METYEAWQEEDEDGGELTFTTAENIKKNSWMLGPNAVKLFEIEAESWNEAMTKYHEKMGWNPYVPMDE